MEGTKTLHKAYNVSVPYYSCLIVFTQQRGIKVECFCEIGDGALLFHDVVLFGVFLPFSFVGLHV